MPGWFNPYRLGTLTLPVADMPVTNAQGGS
jgi:hypothetical protein